jgi:IS5 family transposase
MRRFTGIDLGRAPTPDETAILNLRHLLGQHDLSGRMLDTVDVYLESNGNHVADDYPMSWPNLREENGIAPTTAI